MAGMFGLFNYDKEGPGVDKNAPKKRGLFHFFDLYLKNFWKLVVNSIVYWLLTLPLITSGLAAAGMTNITRNMAVDTHSFGVSDFIDTIKKNWKQALPAGIINVLIFSFLIFDIWFFYVNFQGNYRLVCLAIVATTLIVFLAFRYYFWTILITFKLKLKNVYINAIKMTLLGLKKNIIIFLCMIFVYLFLLILAFAGTPITDFVLLLIILFVLPGLRFLIIEFNVFDAIKKYMILPYYKEHPDEDIELRRRLGVLEETKYCEEDLL